MGAPNAQPTKLCALKAFSTAPLILAVITGIEPTQVITRHDKTKTHLATLQLADETCADGRQLEIWGVQTVQTGALRVMDIVRVTRVYVDKGRFEGVVLRMRYDSCVRCAYEVEGDEMRSVQELVGWREREFGDLSKLARKGCVRSRDWGSARKRRRGEEWGGMDAGCGEVDGVEVVSVHVRVRYGSEGSVETGLEELVKRRCGLCQVARDEGDACVCGCGEWEYGYGAMYVRLREKGEVYVTVLEGDSVGRVLCGVSAESLVRDKRVRDRCAKLLKALVRDGGRFRVVLEKGGVTRLKAILV